MAFIALPPPTDTRIV